MFFLEMQIYKKKERTAIIMEQKNERITFGVLHFHEHNMDGRQVAKSCLAKRIGRMGEIAEGWFAQDDAGLL